MADAYSFVKGGKLKFKGDKHKRSVKCHIIAHVLNCAENFLFSCDAALPVSTLFVSNFMIICCSKKQKKHKRKREHESEDENAVDDDALRHGTL